MKISADGKETTIIEFSKEELEGCRLTYENISRDTIRSRTVIFTIITEAAKLSGNERVIDENTRIDILPDGTGGCVIVLNNVPHTSERLRCVLLFSENADCFFDLARAVKKSTFSSLYKTDGGYALYLEGESTQLGRYGEFGDPLFCDELYRHHLDEHGKLLIEGNALEILGGGASEK